MNNDILQHYSEELRYLTQLFEEFSTTHPTIAHELHFDSQRTEDPHVTRLIQAFALVSAQIKQLLGNNFSELSYTLLDSIYPHYLMPFPACAVIQFVPEQDLNILKKISSGLEIAVHTQNTEQVCHFTTAYNTELLPIEIVEAKLCANTEEINHFFNRTVCRSALKIVLKIYDQEFNFKQLNFKKLRFFINAAQPLVYKVYDLLFCHATNLIGCNKEGEIIFNVPCNAALQPVGFNNYESMLAYSAQSSLSYALLTEFFAFPEKFLFFDIHFSSMMLQQIETNQLTLYCLLKRNEEELEPYFSKHNLLLHCSPIINIFKKTAEPIALDYTSNKYPITPDLDKTKQIQVYQISKATIIDRENNAETCYPLFQKNHFSKEKKYFWQLQRQTVENYQQAYIAIVNEKLQSKTTVDNVLTLNLFCTNGNLPKQLSLNEQELHLQFTAEAVTVDTIKLITNFTPQRQWQLKEENYWRLIAHLNINQYSLFDNHAECAVLKEVLYLYNFVEGNYYTELINGITNIIQETILLRDPSGILNTFIQGLKIKLIVKVDALLGASLFLFGSILSHFFALNCAVSTFIQLEVCDEYYKVLHIWPARSGAKVII